MFKKILLGIVFIVLIFVGIMFFYVHVNWNKTYNISYPELQASSDSTVIARGKYLVYGPAHCSSCHVSSYEEMVNSDKGDEIALKGGVDFPLGPLGIISPANLTPDAETGIGRYSDGEVFRMMRHAVKPDGTTTLNLLMPFWNMADDDLVAVVSYLRSAKPVYNKVQSPSWTFMGKMVRTLAPTFQPIEDATPPAVAPPMAATIERGEYLSRYVTNCVACHTSRDPMTYEATGPEFAGGMEFEPFPELHKVIGVDPELWTRSTNITPHPNSALSKFKTSEAWIARFRQGRLVMHSPMDWGPFSRMTDEDLTAIYLYLNSLEPIENDITEIIFKKE